MKTTVIRCARCGQDHEGIEPRKLARAFAPPEAAPMVWSHWAPCPTNGDPIMFVIPDNSDGVALPGSEVGRGKN